MAFGVVIAPASPGGEKGPWEACSPRAGVSWWQACSVMAGSSPQEGLSLPTALVLLCSGSELQDIWCIRRGVHGSSSPHLSLPLRQAWRKELRQKGGAVGSSCWGTSRELHGRTPSCPPEERGNGGPGPSATVCLGVRAVPRNVHSVTLTSAGAGLWRGFLLQPEQAARARGGHLQHLPVFSLAIL